MSAAAASGDETTRQLLEDPGLPLAPLSVAVVDGLLVRLLLGHVRLEECQREICLGVAQPERRHRHRDLHDLLEVLGRHLGRPRREVVAVGGRVRDETVVVGEDERHLGHRQEEFDRLERRDHRRWQAAIEVVDDHHDPADLWERPKQFGELVAESLQRRILGLLSLAEDADDVLDLRHAHRERRVRDKRDRLRPAHPPGELAKALLHIVAERLRLLGALMQDSEDLGDKRRLRIGRGVVLPRPRVDDEDALLLTQPALDQPEDRRLPRSPPSR